MDAREYVIKSDIPRGTYQTIPCGCAIRPRLLLVDLNIKYGLMGNTIIASLSENIEV